MTVALIRTEVKYVGLSVCAQEMNFISMLLEEMIKVQKPSVIYEDNQGVTFLTNNRQVDMRTKHINISIIIF